MAEAAFTAARITARGACSTGIFNSRSVSGETRTVGPPSMYAIDPMTGAEIWSMRVGNHFGRASMNANGRIYVGETDNPQRTGYLWELDL